MPIAPEAWAFARVEAGSGVDGQGEEQSVVPSDEHIHMPAGFETGWNLRRRDLGNGALLGVAGGYLPFPDTAEERAKVGDPRAAVLERYADLGGYGDAIRAAACRLVDDRLMLDEDADRAVKLACDRGRTRHVCRLSVGDRRP